ncbi:MAG: DUF177 domain-containing protein [Rhodocyclaceae bacterium]|nr:DUF177 domain-containing protein [Rhodocyclaceae bacterium]MBX3668361.1 DUF177 domain-containing protein [Rhodocyclaceae bacterium]
MSRQALRFPLFDPLAFARAGASVAMQFGARELDRLAEAGAVLLAPLDIELAGRRDDEGKCWLDMAVRGTLQLQCQRCLQPMTWTLDTRACLLLVPPGMPWPEDELEDDRYDAIEALPEMDARGLAEDEALLCLPMAPTHTACELPADAAGDAGDKPFAALGRLRRSSNDD